MEKTAALLGAILADEAIEKIAEEKKKWNTPRNRYPEYDTTEDAMKRWAKYVVPGTVAGVALAKKRGYNKAIGAVHGAGIASVGFNFHQLHRDFKAMDKRYPDDPKTANQAKWLGIPYAEKQRAKREANEKTAEVSDDIKDFAFGNRDFSDPENQKTKFWKDRVGGAVPIWAANVPLNAVRSLNNQHLGNPGVSRALNIAGLAAALGVNNARGEALAKKNGVDWKGINLASSTFIPFVTPDSVVKRKVREKNHAE